ncbi:MAG TPA: hypothetical protein VNB64_11915 [Solirubrobacteraceae bacterium]|nr:hypothetical protein [Solirubrobacteraceae bacterium]
MKRLLISAGLAAALVAVPAQAHNGNGGRSDRVKPQREDRVKPQRANRCQPRAVGFNARGVLVASTLTQTAGQATARRGDDRYSGTVEVDVKRANHGAPTGVQTYTLTGGRAKFHDADGDGTAEAPKAGDVVKVHGKVTRLKARCDASGFTPRVTVKQVQFKAPAVPAVPAAPVAG